MMAYEVQLSRKRHAPTVLWLAFVAFMTLRGFALGLAGSRRRLAGHRRHLTQSH
jgi:hypothetical protein